MVPERSKPLVTALATVGPFRGERTATAARSLRKGAQARRRVLDAVVDAIGREELTNLSVAEIGGAVGMSAGHVLYYFGTKDTLFVEALKEVEAQLDDERAAIVASAATPPRRLYRYFKLYLPTNARDPRWSLWIESGTVPAPTPTCPPSSLNSTATGSTT